MPRHLTYKKTEWILGNEILLFILESSVRNVWQYRFKNRLNDKTTYIRKSTGYSEKGLATAEAIAKYREHQTRTMLGLSEEKITIEQCVNEMLRYGSGLGESTKKTFAYFHKVYWDKHFGTKDITNIKTDDIEEYFHWRIHSHSDIKRGAGWGSSKTTVSLSTLKMDKIYLRRLLRYAESKTMILKAPVFPILKKTKRVHKIEDNQSRGRFTEDEYKIIRQDLSNIRKRLKKKNYLPSLVNPDNDFCEVSNHWQSVARKNRDHNWYKRDRSDYDDEYCSLKRRFHKATYWFICMLVGNTGMRPVEVCRLRHSNIRLEIDKSGTSYTIIDIPSNISKTGKERQAIARDLSDTYSRYLEYRQEIEYRFNRKIRETDFVFPSTSRNGEYTTHRSSTEYGTIVRERFKKLKVHTKELPLGGTTVKVYNSLYSFRAFYISQRLKNEVDIYTLSIQIGSSITTIQKYYDTNKIWDFRTQMVKHIHRETSVPKE